MNNYPITFEDYKEDWERFSPIDTAEKLQLCKERYETYRDYQDSQNYFFVEEEGDGEDLGIRYRKNLYELLGLQNVLGTQYCFVVAPSFEPEQVLVFRKDVQEFEVTHLASPQSFWNHFCQGKSLPIEAVQIASATIPTALGIGIFQLLERSINEARARNKTSAVLDGTYYSLMRLDSLQTKTVAQHSPDESSRSGKIISLLKTLIQILFVEGVQLDCDFEITLRSLLH